VTSNVCAVLEICGFPKRSIAEKQHNFTLRTMQSIKDLREVEDQNEDLEIVVRDGTKLELLEYEDNQEMNAFRMSFGDLSSNMSLISERPTELQNLFARNPFMDDPSSLLDAPIDDVHPAPRQFPSAPEPRECKAKRGKKKQEKQEAKQCQEVAGFSSAIASHCLKQAFWQRSRFEPHPHPSMLAFICKPANQIMTRKHVRSVEALQNNVVKEMNILFGQPVHRVFLHEESISIRCVDGCNFAAEFKLTIRGVRLREFLVPVHSVEAHALHYEKREESQSRLS